MKNPALGLAALILSAAAFAEEAPAGAPSPGEIVAAAPASEWGRIPAEDLLVMDLAPDAEGNPREVVIQLMPPPFSQGWVHNIKLLARSGWYDGISVNRVQDNYVVQWGDPNYDNPEATGETKPLPAGLKVMDESDYVAKPDQDDTATAIRLSDHYADWAAFHHGWPVAGDKDGGSWPTHCHGMVGVGRNYSPDTGSGAELYTVIGHAPRQLDRNIALVGRIIEGMEHLSSLPRGKGELSFYAEEEFDKRTPILSVRVASDLHEIPQAASSSEAAGEEYAFEYLSTASETFKTYAEAIANRRDPFFIVPAGGADICNIRVPVRRLSGD